MRPSSKCSGVRVGLILLHFQFWYLLGALKNIIIVAHNINVMGSAKGSVMRPVMLLIMKSGMGLAMGSVFESVTHGVNHEVGHGVSHDVRHDHRVGQGIRLWVGLYMPRSV